MINEIRLAEMLTTQQSRTLLMLASPGKQFTKDDLTREAHLRLISDQMFRKAVAQSTGSILKIVQDCDGNTLDQSRLGSLLTSQQGILVHAYNTKQFDKNSVIHAAAARYESDSNFRDAVAASVGALMAVIMECDEGRDNLIEVPKEMLH